MSDLGKIKGIQYVSPCFDGSGYARASRDYILALHAKGVPIKIKPVSFEHHRPELGENGELLKSLVDNDIEYNVNIIHLTPEHIPLYREPNKFNINLTVWETDKIHDNWVGYCNQADAMIFPCAWNSEVFTKSGVNKPMGVVPHGIDMSEFEGVTDKLEIQGVKDTDYVFYSVFQWTERKNPIGLIRAYHSAFADRDDVVLVLKTYGSDASTASVSQLLRIITGIKNATTLYEKDFPRIAVIGDMLSDKDLIRLHNRGDCYISLSRSEGWGLGYFQAMASGKPTIGTGGTGNAAFMNNANSYLVDYTWAPTFGMPHFLWYTNDQFWTEPDLAHAVRLMKEVESNRDEAARKGLIAKEDIASKYNWDKIGDIMVNEINRLIGETSNG